MADETLTGDYLKLPDPRMARDRSKLKLDHWGNIKRLQPDDEKKLKADYLTGQFNSEQLAAKYGLKRRPIHWWIRCRWSKELAASGLPVPAEPKLAFCARKDPEVWNAIEAEFMRGGKIREIATRHGVNPAGLERKIRKYHWKERKEQLYEANRKRIAGSVGAKMAHFEELSAKFIDAASAKLEQMLGDVTKRSMDASELDKMIKMHSSLYESVKKIPRMGSQTPAQTASEPKESSLPAAQRPAPILKVS